MSARQPTQRDLQRALDLTPAGSRASWELRALIRRGGRGGGVADAKQPVIVPHVPTAERP